MKLAINENGLIKNLKSVFSANRKVLSELVQNGRRAQATSITIRSEVDDDGKCMLVVEDDGIGIQDFANLLTVAQSGWNDAIIDKEQPYGMGALAMLFFGSKVHVESNGRAITIDTEAVLNGEDIGEAQPVSGAKRHGTRIAIYESCATPKELHSWAWELAKYSSIPIIFNGEELSRDCSEDAFISSGQYTRYDTPYGRLYLKGFADSLVVVVQDLEVHKPMFWDKRAILFADNELKARMPDRDQLINHQETMEEIKQHISEIHRMRLREARLELGDEAFVRKYLDEIARWDREQLNEIPILPAQAFRIPNYPCLRDGYGICDEVFDVRKGEVCPNLIIGTSDVSCIGLVAGMFAYSVNAQAIHTLLDPKHWIFDMLYDIESDVFTLSVENPSFSTVEVTHNAALYRTEAVFGKIKLTSEVLNKSVEVESGINLAGYEFQENFGHTLVVEDEALTKYDLFFGLQAPSWIEEILLQSDSYMSEFDEYQDEHVEADASILLGQVRLALGDGRAIDLVKQALEDLPPIVLEQLQSQKVLVNFENKSVLVEDAA